MCDPNFRFVRDLACLTGFAIAFCIQQGVAAESPIASLNDTLRHLEHVEIKGTVRERAWSSLTIPTDVRQDTERFNREVLLEIDSLLLRRDNQRALLSSIREIQALGSTHRIQHDRMLNSGELIFVQKFPDSGLAPAVDNDFGMTIRGERIAGPKFSANIHRMMEGLNDHAIFFGFFDHEFLPAYFTNNTTLKILGDGEFIQVNANGRFGQVQAWLDPKFGHLPRRLRITKEGSDLSNGRRVDKIIMNGGGIWPQGGLRQIQIEANNIVLAHSNGVPYIQDITQSKKYICSSGVEVFYDTHAHIDSLSFNPSLSDDSFRTQIEIPKGYSVTAEGANHLPYAWNGSWAVPVVGELVRLEPISSDDSSWRLWIIYGNIIAFAVLIGFVVFRKLRVD